MNAENEDHNSASRDWSVRTCKERDGEMHPKDPGQHQNSTATKYHSSWNVPYPKESTMYQIDFYLLVSLRPKKRAQLLRWC